MEPAAVPFEDAMVDGGRLREEPPVPSSRVEVVRIVDETDVDAVLELGKAAALGALASVPVIGPVLREVVGVSWIDNRAERLQRFAVELGRDVERIQDRLDAEFVKRRDFEALAEETIERVVQRRNEEKFRQFAAAVANSAAFERPNTRMRERFLDCRANCRAPRAR